MALENDLLNIERSFWTGGPEAYLNHCDETCLVVFADHAGVMNKEDIAGMAEAGRWEDPTLTLKGIECLSDDAAVISYDCETASRDGKPYHALVSSGYARRDGEWKLAFHQQTMVG